MSKSGVVIGIVGAVALAGGIYTVKSIEAIPTGKVGVQYSTGGVKNEILDEGWHFINPLLKVKEFTVGNEQLILSKDKREGSKGNEAFNVATSDDASIAVSFQMSYRYIPDKVVDTYRKFKGMDGEDIVERRVKSVLKSKISEITTDYSMMDIYSGNRSELNAEITKHLNAEFNSDYGIEVLDSSIIDVHPDKKLKSSIDARVKALQEKQQAKAEQEKLKVQKETEKIQAQADAEIERINAQTKADKLKIQAEAEAAANKVVSSSITEELIRMKEAEARLKHGWVTVQGADAVVTDKNK
ncbi:prohibitin family protein [Blautia sp.]|uniref:prohibitin family protein n=1 Tax=Blautia sp. TaxID=1955243 RepID=UPI003AB6A59D